MLDSDRMDALAEMLRAIKVDSVIYLNGVFSEPWCIASPGGQKLAPVFGSKGHIIIYHLLCEGRAYCEIDGLERVELESGDLIALPHGHEHRMGGGRDSAPLNVEKELPGILAHGLELLTVGGNGQSAKFIC